MDIPLTDVITESGLSSPSTPDIIPKSLHQIARDGDVRILETLPEDKLEELSIRINELDEKLLTPLHYAARYSNVEMMKFLIGLGADLNRRGDDDMTPLHYAARYSKKTSNHALKALRQIQKRMSVVDGNSEDPSPRSRKTSLQPDSSLGSPTRRDSDTPDYTAASGASDVVMKLLIDNGADINARDKYQLTALHHAAIRGHVTAIQRLMQTPGIEKEVKK